MSGLFGKDCDSKRIQKVFVYEPKLAASITSNQRIRLYNVVFILLYIFQVGWVISSMGEPYREFLKKADREGFDIMRGSTQLRAEFEYALGDVHDPNRRTKKLSWTDWMDYDIEELAAEKKKDKQESVMDTLSQKYRVPSKYACGFWPSLLLGALGTLHALVLLMQVWSVAFQVWVRYREVDAASVAVPENLMEIPEECFTEEFKNKKKGLGGLDSSKKSHVANPKDGNPVDWYAIPNIKLASNLPTHARIIPDKGKHMLVPLTFYPTLGMTFMYHRRRYVYDPEMQTWVKIRCTTKIPYSVLSDWSGFGSDDEVIMSEIKHGPNFFQVAQPSFVELYKAQLVNPFTVFQLFCVLLWAIDDYLIYSFFSLFMVLMFEGTVVFQRLKSLQALRGMGNETRFHYVYRSKYWIQVDSTELLPGDIISLTRVKPKNRNVFKDASKKGKDAKDGKHKKPPVEDISGGDVVPADLVLLSGSTVVNEASLTGESVPQMKEGVVLDTNTIVDGEEDMTLFDMKNRNKMNVVYAGTKMLQCKGATSDDEKVNSSKLSIPNPPDNGCICFVLRTGFSSAQGKLVRMIEGSQEKVKGHERDTGFLLLLLCFFAVISSSYVLYHGIHDENRSQYELLLHCILIVTSVIRPELPMQMALAVNNSLMTLMKMHVFCTEPYRVPTAGKLDSCLFDKTGTLTTDELVAVGVITTASLNKYNKEKTNDNTAGSKNKSQKPDTDQYLIPMNAIHNEAALVIAGCHSLVVYDDETTGDPLESAALSSMRWTLSSDGYSMRDIATEKKTAGSSIKVAGSQKDISQIQILQRHHFSSKLQRMSCVIRDMNTNHHYCVAKGSPEAIGRLISIVPDGYETMSSSLSKEGYRVIALAYKSTSSDKSDIEKVKESRAACESDLIFAGFIAFTCRVRKDTTAVLYKLKEGGMKIIMVTGDALLTAIHVAKEVDICEPVSGGRKSGGSGNAIEEESNAELKALLEKKQGKKTSDSNSTNGSSKHDGKNEKSNKVHRPIIFLDNRDGSSDEIDLVWKSYDDNSVLEQYNAGRVPELSETYDLAITGKILVKALEYDKEGTRRVLQFFQVFARMTPDLKETVIECLHFVGKLCMMCGDGANDVGALKQADVGVALLSGFGNINVDSDNKDDNDKKDKDNKQVTAYMSQEQLDQIRALPVRLIKMKIRTLGVNPDKYPSLVEKEDLVQLYQIKARELAIKRHDDKNKKDKSKMTKQERQMEQRKLMMEKQAAMAERVKELEAQGVQWAQFVAMKEFWGKEMEDAKKKKAEMAHTRGIEGSAAKMAAQFEDMDTGELPMVTLGDASIAAPFTSKMPSIRNCVDIVRQGRCTLVSSIQMYQILGLQSLISSYSLSALYLDGVKYGDSQMTALGLLGSVSFMSVSRSKPLDKLSKVRPLTSIFHPALIISLLGQFFIHLMTMVFAVRKAKTFLPPDFAVELEGEFKPGILNTVVFLVSSVQQVTVFVVNLQGRPFMTGVTENRPLLWSLVATFILTFMFASETVPQMNKYFQLVPFPNDEMRDYVLTILVMDLVATYVLDIICKFCFCRDILMESMKESMTYKQLYTLGKTFAIIFFIMYHFMGNSETWEQLELMEKEMAEQMEREINGTVADAVGDNIVANTTAEILTGAVNNIAKNLSSSIVHDEF